MLKKVGTGILLSIWFLVACGAQTEPSTTPQAEPAARASLESPAGFGISSLDDPQTILETALAALSSEAAYHFELDFTAEDHESPPFDLSIDGDFQAPDRIQAVQRMYMGGIPFDELVVIVGSTARATNIQSGVWESMPGGALEFLPQELIELDPSQIENLVFVGEEKLADKPVIHLQGSVQAHELGHVFTDFNDMLQIDFWVGQADALLHKVAVTGELTFPGGTSEILYTAQFSDTDRETTIDLPKVGKIGSTPLTGLESPVMRDLYFETNVDWSPDGNQIVFSSDRLDPDQWDRDIYLMDANGSNLKRLTWDPADTMTDDVMPSWSPEGDRILFLSTRDYGFPLFVIDRDGTNMIQLTTFSAENPAWAPDGDRIVFQSDRDGDYNIYVIDADGSNLVQVTDGPADEVFPAWSPDGNQIAFSSGQNDSYDIYVIDADGSNEIRLTDNAASNSNPAWSPGGEHIAFESDQSGEPDIYVMDADGRNALQLTDDPAYDGDLAWAPGGNQIAFISKRDGDFDLYVMDSDGSNVVQLTDNLPEDYNPKWSPDGRRIAFYTQDSEGGFPDWSLICAIDADGSNLVQLTQDWISLDSD